MLKKLLTVSTIALALSCGSSTPIVKPAPPPVVVVEKIKPEIVWNKLTPAVIKQAMQEKKSLMIFFHVENCKWCEAMKKTTFKDPMVIDRLNKQYICISVSAEKEPNLVAALLEESVFPTTIFSLSGHDALIAQGYIPPKIMLDVLDKIETHQQLSELLEQLTPDPADGNN